MLDRLDAGQRRPAHPLGGRGVGGRRPAARGGDPDDPLELLLEEGRPGLAVDTPAVVGVHLDHIRALADLVAHRAHQVVPAVGRLGAEDRLEAWIEALGAVAAGGDDRPGRHLEARAGDDALVDRLLEADVRVAGALGAQVPLGGEPGEQGLARMDRGAGRAERQRLLEHLVVPGGLVVGVEEEVGVALDQPGQKCGAGQLDPPGAVRDRHRVGGPRGGDPLAVDDDHPAVVDRLAVEHPVGDQDGGGWLATGRALGGGEGARQDAGDGQDEQDGQGRVDRVHRDLRRGL